MTSFKILVVYITLFHIFPNFKSVHWPVIFLTKKNQTPSNVIYLSVWYGIILKGNHLKFNIIDSADECRIITNETCLRSPKIIFKTSSKKLEHNYLLQNNIYIIIYFAFAKILFFINITIPETITKVKTLHEQ